MIADLHIHSRFSRATSGDCDAPHLDLAARTKGISLIGTGDFTHPAWRGELEEQLEEAGEGLYRLKEACRLPGPSTPPPLFVLSGEISTIYKKDGKTRKVHHVFLLPSLSDAENVAHRLEAVGNLHSDGRPILGMDSRDLLETVLDACPEAVYIPAHIWTPHFSLLGAFSQFSSLEECYGDLAGLVHAAETGLSSDPPMNRRVSMLDALQLVSNSDAHSPARLGREATLFSCPPGFSALKRAIETGAGLDGTIEFFPEEGKYHLDGHRNCHCCLEPEKTRALDGRCPVCGKKVTVGVLHRVEELADRDAPLGDMKPFESLMPLPELIGETLGVSAASKKVQQQYQLLTNELGPELRILREISLTDAQTAGGALFAEALRRLRAGQVIRQGGYDGEYGVIRLFAPGEREALLGQTSLLGVSMPSVSAASRLKAAPSAAVAPSQPEMKAEMNPEQRAAMESAARVTAVSAGPGTGKTQTLVNRIAYLVEEKAVAPEMITAVTFTRQAAGEMRARLEQRLGKKAARKLHIGTFHSLCQALLPPKPLISPAEQLAVAGEILRDRRERLTPREALSRISALKSGMDVSAPAFLLPAYQTALAERGQRDLDDLLLEALALPGGQKQFSHVLVDEYQDINAVQRKLVRHWAEDGSLFVIGDPDQSIYGFRGADAGCFAALEADFPGAARIRLARNYRSTPEILACAQAVIDPNPGEDRTLTPTRESGMPVRLVCHGDAFREADWIAGEIQRMAGGVDMLSAAAGERECRPVRAFSEIAVLCRTHRQLELIERALGKSSIPCQVSGREDFLADPQVQGALAFFAAMLGNPGALPSALAALWGCGDGLCAQAEQTLKTDENWRQSLTAFDGLSPFLAACDETLPGIRREKPRRLLEGLLAHTRCASRALEKLGQLCAFYPDMPSLLAAVETGEEGDVSRLSGGKPSGAVRLMTLHGAKGLEFPAVILAGLGLGEMPLIHPGEACDMEEERRLLFVGVTRAREELILSYGGAPSPFLDALASAVSREAGEKPWQPRQKQISLFG